MHVHLMFINVILMESDYKVECVRRTTALGQAGDVAFIFMFSLDGIACFSIN